MHCLKLSVTRQNGPPATTHSTLLTHGPTHELTHQRATLTEAQAEGVPLVSCHRMLEPGSSCHFFSSFFLFGQSDFQVSKTIFDSREILFLELLLLFWSSCYFLELLLGSSIWWRELGETPSGIEFIQLIPPLTSHAYSS